MKFKLKAYSIREQGHRENQEDSIYPLHNRLTDDDRLFVLCDGMGGHESGEVASSTVCHAMGETVARLCPNPEAFFSDEMLQQTVANAFDALDAVDGNPTAMRKMGTTMTMLKLHAGGATIAHMGDSRVYHVRQGATPDETQILFVTQDHSLVNDLVRVGELTPEEARHSKQKNVITRAMQPHMERRPKADVYHTADIMPGDYFLMCSDGILERWEDRDVRRCFARTYGDDSARIAGIIRETSDNADNHTAIIVRIDSVEGDAEDTPVSAVQGHAAPPPSMPAMPPTTPGVYAEMPPPPAARPTVGMQDSTKPTMPPPAPETDKPDSIWWLWALVAIVLALVALLVFLVIRLKMALGG